MPSEIHEHFDADGNLTGHTVVTRESEWDDESRARALRLAEYEAGMCKCGCGLPMSEAHKDQIFGVSTVTCYAERAKRIAARAAEKAAKDAKKPDGWNDGVFYVAQPYTPEED